MSKKSEVRLEEQPITDTYNGVGDMKYKVRRRKLQPLLEKSTLTTRRTVRNFQDPEQKLQKRKAENNKAIKLL
jgi:hypothetical protein